jgi:hypothetical protein
MNNTPTFSAIKEKIEKLLRLADPTRGGSQAERDLALRKAQELMTEHQLSELDLELTEKHLRPWEITEFRIRVERREQPWDKFIFWCLKEVTDCRIIYSSEWAAGYKKHLVFLVVGTAEDIAFAQLLVPVIDKALNRGCHAWLRSQGLKWTAFHGKGYYHGLVTGFIEASTEGRAAVWRKQTKEKVDRYAIVVADKKDAIAAYVNDTIGKLGQKRSKSGYTYNRSAAAAGHAAGANINFTSAIAGNNSGLLK